MQNMSVALYYSLRIPGQVEAMLWGGEEWWGRFKHVVKEDMQWGGVTDEDTRDGGRWSAVVTPKGSSQKKIS